MVRSRPLKVGVYEASRTPALYTPLPPKGIIAYAARTVNKYHPPALSMEDGGTKRGTDRTRRGQSPTGQAESTKSLDHFTFFDT